MKRTEPSELVVKSWARLMRVADQLLSAVEKDLKQAGHPPLAWYDVLLELRRAGDAGLRPFELERELLLAQHNVSRLIDRMESSALVLRKPADDDGRGQRVTITAEGQAKLKSMWPDYAASIERHVGSKLKGDDKARQLLDLLGLLVRAQ